MNSRKMPPEKNGFIQTLNQMGYMTEFFPRPDYPEFLQLDGRESVGVIVRK